MIRNCFAILIFSCFLAACGSISSEGDNPAPATTPEPTIDVDSGFTAEFLEGKTLYKASSYQGNKYLDHYSFQDGKISIYSELFYETHTFDYELTDYQTTSGIISYTNVYPISLSIKAIDDSKISYCYVYSGVESVVQCDSSDAFFFFLKEDSANGYLASCTDLETCETNFIVGDWYVEFERNGAIGESHIVISESSIDTYEIGNGQIMDEWHSGLDINKSYKFIVEGSGSTYNVNGDLITITSTLEQTSTAKILELPSEVEVFSWDIGNGDAGEQVSFEYRFTDGNLILTSSEQDDATYALSNN